MKALLCATFLVACALGARAQGTLQFTIDLSGGNEVPPNIGPGIGSGTFTLIGSDLSYDLSTQLAYQGGAIPVHATINGPAGPGSTAAIIFDLLIKGFKP